MDALTLVKQSIPDPSRNTLRFLASALTDEIERTSNPSRKAKLTERRDSLLRSAAQARAPIAEQSTTESEKAPAWLKAAIGQLETAARIAAPATESEIDAEVKTAQTATAYEVESKTDPSTRPDFSRKLEAIDETVADSRDFAAAQRKIWADITGQTDTSQEASRDDWRSEFRNGTSDMSKYTAKLRAEEAAKRQAEQDRYEETRREMGFPSGYGR